MPKLWLDTISSARPSKSTCWTACSLSGPLSLLFLDSSPWTFALNPVKLNANFATGRAESNSKYPHFCILTAAFYFLLYSLTFPQYQIFFRICLSLSPTALVMLLLTGGCPQLACNDLHCSTTLTKWNLLCHSHMFYMHGSTGHGIARLTLASCGAHLLSPVSSVSPVHNACCRGNKQS